MLTIPGAPWTIGAMSTAIFQITQYKGVPLQATNALRSAAFVLEQLDDNVRSDTISDCVKQLGAERAMLTTKLNEAMLVFNKAAATVEAAASTSQKVTEEASN